ncbi:hypothetical protein COP2_047029 [Malus domestica]
MAAADNNKRKRFAWDLSNCFQKDSGTSPCPTCCVGSPMKPCLEKLDNDAIHTHQTEKLVNDLKKIIRLCREKFREHSGKGQISC